MVSKSASDKQEKILFILIDGVGDVGIPQFGGKTPLYHANTPFLDTIAGAKILSIGSKDSFIQLFLVRRSTDQSLSSEHPSLSTSSSSPFPSHPSTHMQMLD